MLTMVNTSREALCPQPSSSQIAISSSFSPTNKAELCHTYLKQLGELRNLYDQGILTENEYTEQKKISLML